MDEYKSSGCIVKLERSFELIVLENTCPGIFDIFEDFEQRDGRKFLYPDLYEKRLCP